MAEINLESYYINELKKNSHEAFNYLYRVYADRLYGFVVLHTKSKTIAEEIVQDTYIKIWDNRHLLSTDLSFKSFIFTIAKHKIIDEFRRQINQVDFQEYISFIENQVSDEGTTDALVLYEEFSKALNNIKDGLSKQQRLIFELSREKGYTNKQIADKLSISEQTVKNQISSALKYMRTRIKSYNQLFIFFL